MSSSGLFLHITDFVSRQRPVNRAALRFETAINIDLGIDGDDAYDFINKFSEEFGVDMSNFPYDKFFGSESGFVPIGILTWIASKLFSVPGISIAPLTIGMLVKAAEEKKWPEQ